MGKRLLVGRELRSTELGETLLPKRIALPVFASDALPSVAYAPDEILLTLSQAGLAAYSFSRKIALLVAVVNVQRLRRRRATRRAAAAGRTTVQV